MATDSFSRTPSLPVRFARSDLIHVVHVWQCVCVCVCVCACVCLCVLVRFLRMRACFYVCMRVCTYTWRSYPARSTRWNLAETSSKPAARRGAGSFCCTVMVKMECDRLECLFISVPVRVHVVT